MHFLYPTIIYLQENELKNKTMPKIRKGFGFLSPILTNDDEEKEPKTTDEKPKNKGFFSFLRKTKNNRREFIMNDKEKIEQLEAQLKETTDLANKLKYFLFGDKPVDADTINYGGWWEANGLWGSYQVNVLKTKKPGENLKT